jgi:integrase
MPQELKKSKSKAGRRGNNEGSIYQRKDGRWCGSVTTGYKTNGTPIRKDVYGKTRNEVAQKVASMATEVFKIGYTTVSSRNDTNFETLFREWYELRKAPNITDVTDEKFRSMMMKHIFPAFGVLDVKDVDFKRLQKFFNKMKTVKVKDKVGYSSDFIGKTKNLLNNFFKDAVRQHIVSVNPIEDVDVKKADNDATDDDGKAQALRPEVRKAVLEWVEENPLLRPVLIIGTFTGLRPQETIALHWSNVNFNLKTLSVKKALKRVVEFDDDWNVISRGVKIGATKTKKSVRTIKMPDIVVEAFLEWKKYCHQKGIHSEFVFPNTKTGEMRTYSSLRSLLRRFIAKHNLEKEGITLYTLRHTFATVLLEQRENPKIVMELMGHSKIKTTLDQYSHIVDSTVFEETARTLDSVYNSLTQKNPPNLRDSADLYAI